MLINNKILLLDGAMGTMLNLAAGEYPESINIENPNRVKAIHEQYLSMGSQMICTNTFGANAKKLVKYSVKEVIFSAVKIAKEAASPYNALVALDIGPIGELMQPLGNLSFDCAYELFKEQVVLGAEAKVDAILIETFTSLQEARCAVLAAKENSNLPIICTMSFEQNKRTFLGTSIHSMALTLEGLGVDMIGINCSLGPKEMYDMAKDLMSFTSLPILIKPNAGMPKVINSVTAYDLTEEDFAKFMAKIISLGVSAVGGCCGTTPSFIKELKKEVDKSSVKKFTKTYKSVSAVCSASQTVIIDKVRIIGERINPTGKPKIKEALKTDNLDFIISEAITQIENHADILDINVGLPGIDEKAAMLKVISAVSEITTAPLQIDSSSCVVLEAALRIYEGKAIVNSVNADEESLNSILPLVKKYGAAVVGLTLDKNGIPKTAKDRFILAKKIVDRAISFGIKREDVYIDCLTLSSGAMQDYAYETLEAIRLVKQKLKVKTVLGVSNISFGLPARERLNEVFLSLALNSGLDLPIINPSSSEMVDAIYCYHQLKNIDKSSEKYIDRFSAPIEIKESSKKSLDIDYCIKKGLKDDAKIAVKKLLETTDALEIVSNVLIPILDEVGQSYEKNIIFLPQLLQSAESAKACFDIVRSEIKKSGAKEKAPGKIVLATVKGDVHDIGKNIVKVVLENYGYEIIDLGKNVEPSHVLEVALNQNVKLVGLSALMTTTLSSMEETIRLLKDNALNIKVMVGGAVLTASYAKKIGADYYSKDATGAVEIARKVFS